MYPNKYIHQTGLASPAIIRNGNIKARSLWMLSSRKLNWDLVNKRGQAGLPVIQFSDACFTSFGAFSLILNFGLDFIVLHLIVFFVYVCVRFQVSQSA